MKYWRPILPWPVQLPVQECVVGSPRPRRVEPGAKIGGVERRLWPYFEWLPFDSDIGQPSEIER